MKKKKQQDKLGPWKKIKASGGTYAYFREVNNDPEYYIIEVSPRLLWDNGKDWYNGKAWKFEINFPSSPNDIEITGEGFKTLKAAKEAVDALLRDVAGFKI